MEIPTGLFCGIVDTECPFVKTDIFENNYCGAFGEIKLERDHDTFWGVRCPACLIACPNGGMITIMPKDVL